MTVALAVIFMVLGACRKKSTEFIPVPVGALQPLPRTFAVESITCETSGTGAWVQDWQAQFQYDATGRPAGFDMLGGTWEERGDFAYDAQGLLESVTLATTDTSTTSLSRFEYAYLDGTVQGCSYFEDAGGIWELIIIYSYSYDTTGRLDAHQRDEVAGPNWNNWYDYDELGRLSLKTASGYHVSNHVTYFYDPQNRLSSTLYENYYLGYGSYLTIYLYNGDGRLATILRDSDREDFAYDGDGRLLTITRADLVDGDPVETERITYTYMPMYWGVVLLSDMVPNDHRRELYTFNEGSVPLFPLNFERFMLYAEELNRYLGK